MSPARAGKRAGSGKRFPRHVAIIMDGNGRWATSRGKRRTEGHKAGIDSVQAVLEACIELGIEELTLYAFSTENWKRPRTEIAFLMRTLRAYLVKHRRKMLKDDVRLDVLGDVSRLPAGVQREIAKTIDATKGCKTLAVNLALNYGAHEEIARAARLLAEDVEGGKVKAAEITPEMLEKRLYTDGHLPVDLIVRTAGEVRLSNFLLWQACYAELWFTPVLWPDFRQLHLEEAIEDYQRRQRRFGGLQSES